MTTERSIVEAAARLRRTGEPHLVATLVEARGAHRTPGARMVLTRFRWIAGAASGGYLASDLARDAWERTANGPVLATFRGGTPDEDIRAAFGLACDSSVEVLLERTASSGRAGAIDALEVATRCYRTQRRGAVATVYRSDVPELPTGARLALIANHAARSGSAGPRSNAERCAGSIEQERDAFDPHLRELVAADMRAAIATGESGSRHYETPFGAVDVFLEAILPPPRLFLFGTGHDAVPIGQLARSLGWDLVVCARDERHVARDRFTFADEYLLGKPEEIAARVCEADRAVAIVMNHDLARDRECVTTLLATPVRHIAVLGSSLLMREVIDPRVRSPRGPGMSDELAFGIIVDALAALGRTAHLPSVHAGGSAATIAAAPAR